MNCPKCGCQTRVSVSSDEGTEVFRKRKCVACNYIFSTHEGVVPNEHPRVKQAFKNKRNRYNNYEYHKKWELRHPDYYKDYFKKYKQREEE